MIADICTRLDGLPLAIELAAARTRAFPITQIAARLNDRFRLLTGGSRTALPRQQTLRAVVDWSYELLFDDEQRVFERLSVFPGGCDLATAEAVCADDDARGGRRRRPPPRARRQVAGGRRAERATGCGSPSCRRSPSTAGSGSPNAATPCASATRWRAHFAAAVRARAPPPSPATSQRAWLTAIDQEHDNLRAALDWAVANDDAETALTIAGGASWPHWLAGTVVEGRRWLDDAFACGGEADERTRALALTGRGLLDFLAGAPEHSDDDLADGARDLRAPRRRRVDGAGALVLRRAGRRPRRPRRGPPPPARACSTSTASRPRTRSPSPPASYSRAKLAILDGDLDAAERHYRAATEGFARLDRPVMNSMCLGMVADFDERAGDYPAAIRTLEAAIETNESLLGGFTGSLAGPPRMGAAPRRPARRGPRRSTSGRSTRPAGCDTPMVLFLALAGLAVAAPAPRPRRRGGRGGHRGARALPGRRAPPVPEPHRPQTTDLQAAAAVCCAVLAVIAAERGRTGAGGHAARAGRAPARTTRASTVPPFQQDDVDRAREAAIAALGADAFARRVRAGPARATRASAADGAA